MHTPAFSQQSIRVRAAHDPARVLIAQWGNTPGVGENHLR